MTTTGTLFPEIGPEAIRAIRVPILLLSGAHSYPFLAMTDEKLASLLPDSCRIVFEDAGHQMWLKHPRECRDDAVKFFMEHGGPALD
jgi:pimeloyl-ACP methyl ester carboxylesterase